MSVVPAEIAGIGSTALKLRVATGFDPMKSGVGPEEYFVLSRIDGSQTLREVLLATGLPLERAIQIVQRLRAIGALLLPGEAAAPATASTPTPVRPAVPQTPRTLTPMPPTRPSTANIAISRTLTPMRRPASGTGTDEPTAADRILDTTLPNLTAQERAVLAEVVELDDGDRRKILAVARLLGGNDPYEILGVPHGADKKALKRAYFRLSKDIHPDRYYGKKLGSFGPRLEMVFEAVRRAYATLTEGGARASSQHPTVRDTSADQPQTPQEYAAELYERACALEVGGDALEAMKLFAAALRVDPQPRYLRRAATCALAAKQPKTALEYAKKAQSDAPDDPSSARLLAMAFRAAGKLADAEEVLVMAMAMKSENDVLLGELRNDLAEVRRLLTNG